MNLQVVFFNHQPRPHGIQQGIFGDQLARVLYQDAQHVKSPGTNEHGLTVSQQAAFMALERKGAKNAVFGYGRVGYWEH